MIVAMYISMVLLGVTLFFLSIKVNEVIGRVNELSELHKEEE